VSEKKVWVCVRGESEKKVVSEEGEGCVWVRRTRVKKSKKSVCVVCGCEKKSKKGEKKKEKKSVCVSEKWGKSMCEKRGGEGEREKREREEKKKKSE
jgi:hypothetical protein